MFFCLAGFFYLELLYFVCIHTLHKIVLVTVFLLFKKKFFRTLHNTCKASNFVHNICYLLILSFMFLAFNVSDVNAQNVITPDSFKAIMSNYITCRSCLLILFSVSRWSLFDRFCGFHPWCAPK